MINNGIIPVLATKSTAPAYSTDNVASDDSSTDFSRTLEQQMQEPATLTDKIAGQQDVEKDVTTVEDRLRALLEKGTLKDGTPLSAEQIAHIQQLLAQISAGQPPAKSDELLSQLDMNSDKGDGKHQPPLQSVMTSVYNQLPGAKPALANIEPQTAVVQRAGEHIPALPTAEKKSKPTHDTPALIGNMPGIKPKREIAEGDKPVVAKPEAELRPADTFQTHLKTTTSQPQESREETASFTSTPIAADAKVRSDSTNTIASAPVLNQQLGTPAWQQALSQQLSLFTRNGVHNAELRLHPEELGALQISMKMSNDQVQVHFVSASHQVRAAIEAAMPHLKTSLAESGINLGNGSVGSETPSQWDQHASSSSHHSQDENDAESEMPLTMSNEALGHIERKVARAGGVDTFA